jgi:uncharacterized damage-inducible protein DinB
MQRKDGKPDNRFLDIRLQTNTFYMSAGKNFLETAIKRLKYYKDLGDKTFEQLNDLDFHYQPNEESNSIAIIIQHMAGNMLSRWTNFLTENGEKEWRKRDAEFETAQKTKAEIIALWEKGWDCFLSTLTSLKKKDLKKTVTIRKEELTVIDAINRQLAHYPYHIGQIIYAAKVIKNKTWKNLSIPKGDSVAYNSSNDIKDPAKKF